MKRLNDVFENAFLGAGIFEKLNNLDVPWKLSVSSDVLDFEYFGNISGYKYISPLLNKILTGETITDNERIQMANIIYSLYDVNWQKEWNTRLVQYDPIQNYSMTEEMIDDETVTEYGKQHTHTEDIDHTKTGTDTRTPNISTTRTDNLQHQRTASGTITPNTTETITPNTTETNTPNTTETNTPNSTENINEQIYGFNSSLPSNKGSEQRTTTGTNTTTKTGTNTTTLTGTSTTTLTGTESNSENETLQDTGTETTQHTGQETTSYNTTNNDNGTITDVDDGNDTTTRNYVLTREGNIGVTTSQQMLESERNLWKWDFFHEVVFPDIDKILTIQIY